MSFVSVGTTLAVGSAVAKGVGAGMQIHKANQALQELNKQPQPNYSEDPRTTNAFNRAEAMSNQGFTAQQNAGFDQNLAMQNSAQFQNAVDIGGGNLASTINAGLQNNNIQAINNHAGQDAELQKSNMRYADTLATGLQSQQNLINSQKIARRQLLDQSYGAAKSQGNENLFGAIDSLGNIGAQFATGGMGKTAAPGVDLPTPTNYR